MITSAILEASSEAVPITKLLQKSNLSHSRLSQFLQNLLGAELVTKIECEKKNTYVITDRGRMFLEEYKKFFDFAKNFGFEP